VRIEDPVRLLGRLRLGREEYCQRLLTMLILAGPYPPWNTPSRPSPRGLRFLQALDRLSFGQAAWATAPQFVDEFDLPKRHEQEPGAAPDYALVWDRRLWMVELKTERASHRPTQLPLYFELAAHHYPRARIDLTYLTPTMALAPPPTAAGMRFAQLDWTQVAPLVAQLWGDSDPAERAAADMMLAALASIGDSWANWRANQLTTAGRATPDPAAAEPAADPADLLQAALAVAACTAADGHQRVVDDPAANLEALQQLRLAVRQAICSTPADAPLRRVLPWLWSAATSSGRALTPSGEVSGYELRLSRYRTPIC
jgi:hypothetical protein